MYENLMTKLDNDVHVVVILIEYTEETNTR